MSSFGGFDHELVIGSVTEKFRLLRDENGATLYNVIEEIPQYRNPLSFTQEDWIGGHGQHDYKTGDKYYEGQSIDTTQEGKVFLGPLINEVTVTGPAYLDSAPAHFLWCPSWGTARLLCSTAGNIYYYDGTYWVAAAMSGSGAITGVTGLCFYNGVAYAARGVSSTYATSTDGATWTATDLTDDDMTGFFNAPNSAGTAQILWGWAANKLYSTTDGQASGSQWDSGASIGDTSGDITNVFLINDNLMIGREDNLYHYDSNGGIHPLMDDLKHNRSTRNFKYVTQWQTGTYFSLATGLGEITSYNAFAPMGALVDIDDIGKAGTTVGLTADTNHIYQAIDEGTNSHIYKIRETRKGGALRWEICPWIFLGARTCATAKVVQHSATDRRLWFGYTSGTNYSTGYVKLSENPLADTLAQYTTSGFLRMSYDYGSNANWDKMWQSAVIEQSKINLGSPTISGSGETIQLKYRDDTDITASPIIAAYNTPGVVETNFTSALTDKRIQFELNLASDTSTSTPLVTYFQAKGIEKPVTERIHEATYAIGDEPTNRAKTLRDLLRTGRSTTTLIKFADLRYKENTAGTAGTDYVYCVMEPGYPREVELVHTKERGPELGMQVRLREVSFA